MGVADVDVRPTTVLKDYKNCRDRQLYWEREMTAYTTLDWATPRLMYSGEYWIEMERCTPILELGQDLSRKYRDPLRELLQAVHDAGYWHRDIDLSNVVVHPSRGPLLIDWEWFCESSGPLSYDLWGHEAAGVDPAWSDWSVSWNNGGPNIPGKFWNKGE